MKLFTISTEQILSGINSSFHNSRGGLWTIGSTFNPFIAPSSGSSSGIGIINASPDFTDISGAVVVDTPIGSVVDTTTGGTFLYITGDDGHFYKLDMSSDGAPTDLRSGTPITTPKEGMAIFQARGESQRYLYYFQNTQIGRWDLSGTHPTGWTDNHFTGLTNAIHITHRIFDRVYYTNGSKIGMIYDNGTSAAVNDVNVLDFEDDYIATTISDDGQYFVAGITKNPNGLLGQSSTKVVFWDQNSGSWQREWNIPAISISAIRNIGGIQYAVTPTGIYAFTFNSSPQLVQNVPTTLGSTVHNATDVYNEAILIGNSTKTSSYGKMTPNVPTALFNPYIHSGTAKLVLANAKIERLFVGTSSDKLYRANITSAGTSSSKAVTTAIDLKDRYTINRIRFTFAEPLASGDQMTVLAAPTPDSSLSGFGATNEISFANKGAVRVANLYSNLECESLLLDIAFTGLSIKQIDVYGEPTKT